MQEISGHIEVAAMSLRIDRLLAESRHEAELLSSICFPYHKSNTAQLPDLQEPFCRIFK